MVTKLAHIRLWLGRVRWIELMTRWSGLFRQLLGTGATHWAILLMPSCGQTNSSVLTRVWQLVIDLERRHNVIWEKRSTVQGLAKNSINATHIPSQSPHQLTINRHIIWLNLVVIKHIRGVLTLLSLFNVIMFGAPELWWWGALANLSIWFWFDVLYKFTLHCNQDDCTVQ